MNGLCNAVLLLALSFGSHACRSPSGGSKVLPEDEADYDRLVTLVFEQEWRPAPGRVIDVRVERLQPPGEQAQYSLILNGDCPVVDVTYPGEPYSIAISGDEILFSGHSIELGQTNDEIVLDGTPHRLHIGNVTHVFTGGQLSGGFGFVTTR